MPELAPSYIIVGAGVFGASTALYLSRQKPSPTIILVDRFPYPCPIAASHDINKIVRSDYGDIFYCKLGLKALERWRNDPLFEMWYHQSGLLKATDHNADLVDKTLDNYKELGVDVGAELFRPAELKTRFKGLYSETDLTDVENILWNPSSGWAEAATALKYTLDAVAQNGVHYITADVTTLIMKDGACTGVRTEDGRTFTAKKIILCTGAYTAKLIADSAPTQPELQVSGFLGHRPWMRQFTACETCLLTLVVLQDNHSCPMICSRDLSFRKSSAPSQPLLLHFQLKSIPIKDYADSQVHRSETESPPVASAKQL